jgi:hypothetical protein
LMFMVEASPSRDETAIDAEEGEDHDVFHG